MSQNSNGGPGISIYLYVKDVDSVFKKAVSLGAKVIREVKNIVLWSLTPDEYINNDKSLTITYGTGLSP
jgi:hypothetical protein